MKNEKEKHIIQALSIIGSGVSFLPNDASQLVNRLLLLLGSKKAGNNNCFNEASAILDQLMNMKIMNKYQYKDILSHAGSGGRVEENKEEILCCVRAGF